MKRIFYKAINRIANALGIRRLASWAYCGWFRSWMEKDPVMGYWKFADDYIGKCPALRAKSRD